ncbi:MAG: hypothetical protein K6B39_08640 [Lachnospiraceae bacterium]|nr:hypothetical protein [Lachnospiraceae bacterium]
MSRIRKDYEKSRRARFLSFVRGDDPVVTPDRTEEWKRKVEERAESDRLENASYLELPDIDLQARERERINTKGVRVFRRIYYVLALVMCFLIAGMLILNIAYMPEFGSATAPTDNEVAERYLEKGGEETGVVNAVTGMILQYRAFDTFGETNVLFIGACTVIILLLHREGENAANRRRKKEAEEAGDTAESDRVTFSPEYDRRGDIILQKIASLVVPMIFLFGLYILLNGHLSPGGGFSGGAVLGAGLILYNQAFGFRRTERFFDEKIYDVLKVGSLCLYAMIIGYYLFTGANGIASIVPLGRLGDILSSGLILPINLLVGVEVACTMYAFYALFRKGSF